MADEIIDKDLPIVDCHTHLWVLPTSRYLFDDIHADLATSGHNFRATVYVECSAMYRTEGPEELRCVGEAEFVAGMAAMSDSGLFGPTKICAGFVGAADLTASSTLDEVLDALAVASGGRLKGIRGAADWDADPSVNTTTRPFAPEGLMLDARFCAGVARLAERQLVYDAWQYYPQLPELCSLADAVPTATIVVNHCGGLLAIGPYAGDGNFARWKARVSEIAERPNTLMKLGGLSGRRCGFEFGARKSPATAQELAALWGPYIETCIELFGAERCMFESNLPVDKVSGNVRTIWNAFKLITAGCSAEEKSALFSQNAARTYGIALPN